jgi:hypothetical protein
MVNFGIIYGISAFGLSQRLGIPRGEAATIIDNYFKQFPGVKRFMEQIVEDAKTCGYVETLTGRRRTIRDINRKCASLAAGSNDSRGCCPARFGRLGYANDHHATTGKRLGDGFADSTAGSSYERCSIFERQIHADRKLKNPSTE